MELHLVVEVEMMVEHPVLRQTEIDPMEVPHRALDRQRRVREQTMQKVAQMALGRNKWQEQIDGRAKSYELPRSNWREDGRAKSFR